MQNSNEVMQRCSQIYISPTSKYQFSERHGKQYHVHGLKSELPVELHVKVVEVGTSSDRNPSQIRPSHHGEGSQFKSTND